MTDSDEILDRHLIIEEPEQIIEPQWALVSYDTNKGKLTIDQLKPDPYPDTGNKAFQNEQPAATGKYKPGFMWYVHIENGIVTKISFL